MKQTISDLTLNCGIKKPRTRGFSLIELAIVLGLAGVLLASLWGVVAHVRENMKREQLLNQITVSVKNIRSFYENQGYIQTPAGSGSFENLTNYLLEQGVLPMEMIMDRSATPLRAITPWGATDSDGSFFVDNTHDSSTLESGFFRIRLEDLDFATCVFLSSNLSASSNPPGLQGVTINSNSLDMPVYVDDAADDCDDDSDNEVELIYRLRWTRRQ